MKRIGTFFLSAVLALVSAAEADDTSRRQELAAQLLDAMQMEKQMESQVDAMKASIGQMVPGGAGAGAGSEFLDLILAEMSFENLKSEYVAVYAEVFTAAELQGLLAFYRSPVGRSWAEKQPEVNMRLMQISQSKMAKLMPRIMEEMTKNMPQGMSDMMLQGAEPAPAPAAADESE